MLNIGAGEILVIALVALIVVGPEQLPGLIRRVGKTIGQVRAMTDGLKAEFMSSLDETNELKKIADPKSWTSGAGTPDDPIVPHGISDKASESDKDDEPSGKPSSDAEAGGLS